MSHEHNKTPFVNFSTLQKECPRCGEINDKCGMFQETGFVMCRMDIGNGEEPRTDSNGWDYWPFDNGEASQHHEPYTALKNCLELSTEDTQAMLKRGLDLSSIEKLGYKTIPYRRGENGLNEIVELLDEKFKLKSVPGFYIKDEKRQLNVEYKQTLIPVRTFSGKIAHFILRNNSETKNNRKRSKYIMLSSDRKDEGEKCNPKIHFPLGSEKCTSEVRITEGILKADIATQLGDVYTIGLNGLYSNGLVSALDILEVSKVKICLDIDWKTNKHVLNGLRRIYSTVNNAGFEVAIEDWNEADGKGIDDVLLSKGHIWELPKEDIEYILERPLFDPANWVYINKTSQFVDLEILKKFDEKHFNNHFAKYKEDFAKEAKLIVRQCDSFAYLPEKEKFVIEDGYQNLNLWRPSDIQPVEDNARLKFFFDHLNYIFPNDEEGQKDMLLDWIASVVQYRGKKFSYALLLHGEQGTGKSWIVHCLSLILGQGNVDTIPNDYINNDYNTRMEAKELLIINEVMAMGKKAFMNRMKDYIDEKRITINTKFVPEYPMPFLTNWFLTTNYDDALYIDDRDRKYLILSSKADPGDDKQATARGKKLFRWSGGGKEDLPIQKENIAALYYFLKNRKIVNSPFGKAPQTKAKSHMRDESLPPLVRYVKESIEFCDWPFNNDLVCPQEIKLYPEIAKQFPRESDTAWGKALTRAGAIPYGTTFYEDGDIKEKKRQRIVIKSEGRKRQIWILRKHQMYANLESSVLERLYSERNKKGKPENDSSASNDPI